MAILRANKQVEVSIRVDVNKLWSSIVSNIKYGSDVCGITLFVYAFMNYHEIFRHQFEEWICNTALIEEKSDASICLAHVQVLVTIMININKTQLTARKTVSVEQLCLSF